MSPRQKNGTRESGDGSEGRLEQTEALTTEQKKEIKRKWPGEGGEKGKEDQIRQRKT